ncbi:hypothetical protein Peur_006602 [Populus x canadensis]
MAALAIIASGPQTPSAPRFDNTSAINGDLYLLIFGGCSHSIFFNDLHVLDFRLARERNPLACEGLGVCSVLINGERHLVAFGGYNGKYNNENSTEQDLGFEIDALKEEKKVLELSLAEVRADNFRLTEKIDEVNGTHAELSKELHSVQGQLVAERSRCFKLEAQIAELQMMLESLQSIENEVQLLRRQKLMMLKALQKRSKFCKISSNLMPFSSTSDILIENQKSPSSIPPVIFSLEGL